MRIWTKQVEETILPNMFSTAGCAARLISVSAGRPPTQRRPSAAAVAISALSGFRVLLCYYVSLYMHILTAIYSHMYMCVYIYIYIEREREKQNEMVK